MKLRIGSRGSQLALWQAHHIADQLVERGHETEIRIIRTTGDQMQHSSFDAGSSVDGKGIFIKEIEEALESKEIDLAVHSLKDLPTTLDSRFCIAAIPKRADARDVWVCEPYWSLNTLPSGGRIGTSSPRRKAQILALRPDVEFVQIRGNIDTRLRKLGEGECEALVLAAAGLDRLERTERVHYRFSPDELCPAPGQGALAIETRNWQLGESCESERAIGAALGFLDHAETRFAVESERVTLAALGGGCSLPIGVHCVPVGEGWRLYAQVVAPDGETMIQIVQECDLDITAAALGQLVAGYLISRGALDLLDGSDAPPSRV